jgi:hypothetical protein
MDVRLHKKGHEITMNSPDDKTEIAGIRRRPSTVVFLADLERGSN